MQAGKAVLDVTYLCLTGVCGVAYCGFDLKYYVMNVAATVPLHCGGDCPAVSVPHDYDKLCPQVFYGIFHAPQVKAADEVSGVAYYKEVAYSGGKYVLRRYAGVGAGDDYRVGVLTVYCGIPAYFRGELCMVYGVSEILVVAAYEFFKGCARLFRQDFFIKARLTGPL